MNNTFVAVAASALAVVIALWLLHRQRQKPQPAWNSRTVLPSDPIDPFYGEHRPIRDSFGTTAYVNIKVSAWPRYDYENHIYDIRGTTRSFAELCLRSLQDHSDALVQALADQSESALADLERLIGNDLAMQFLMSDLGSRIFSDGNEDNLSARVSIRGSAPENGNVLAFRESAA